MSLGIDPRELKVSVGDDGILLVDSRTLMFTPEVFRYGIERHKELAPKGKTPVLIEVESVNFKDLQELTKIGRSQEVESMTAAVAIVTRTIPGLKLANLFMSLFKNPYPMKLHSDADAARNWLRQYVS